MLTRENIAKWTEVLFDEQATLEQQQASADSIYAALGRLVTPGQQHTLTPQGKALSGADAGTCLLDCLRTRAFVQGLDRAIRSKLPGPVHVFYAGCGPFATLMLPLTARFSSQQVTWTLMDIHPGSIEATRTVLEHLNLGSYVRDYLVGDAAQHQLHGEPPDIIVVEVLQRALIGEPQVAVVANLLAQTGPETILVPENITLTARLINLVKELEQIGPLKRGERQTLGPLFELNATAVRQWGPVLESGVIPANQVECTEPVGEQQVFCVCTHIQTFADVSIEEYQSVLTHPLRLPQVPTTQGTRRFEYHLGLEPGLVYCP